MTRVAIVTGGSRGIGRAAAERLAADGTAVVIVYAGNKTEADSAVEGIRAAGGQAVAAQADVADEVAVAAAFDLAEQTFGGVDVVVNSAGIMPLGTVADMDLEVFDRVQRTNGRGTFVVAQQAARRVRDGGAIINVSSSVVGLRFPQYGAYAMSKGGVEALTLILARELRGRDITVNVVAPGPTATALFLEGKDAATIDTLAKQAPLERIGSPGDIAEVISFLAGPARWINGQTIRANGGII
ncbi:SDR family oxidoreductase [Lentzea aerocolonigenes]|uniref:SDR family oxidoreductase n=1 Tax=Lentzea aerocolonigenes TaxID=68170 RepID=UPI0004C372F6|nr:SDR family oxidoreductase [Lentzea aerocolonigenes]MCP2241394.1 3-oxoacyl-[acyl-carrier protein] reductase [Lentzea aerocolonigenes]